MDVYKLYLKTVHHRVHNIEKWKSNIQPQKSAKINNIYGMAGGF